MHTENNLDALLFQKYPHPSHRGILAFGNPSPLGISNNLLGGRGGECFLETHIVWVSKNHKVCVLLYVANCPKQNYYYYYPYYCYCVDLLINFLFMLIGHLRVDLNLIMKMRVGAKFLL